MITVSSKLTWACVVGCAALAGLATTRAAAEVTPTDGNPYSVISDRNVFHLNPPPPPSSADDKPVELPKVALTGIIGKGNAMKVLLAIPPKNPKDSWTYLTLAPGQREQDVELVRIHAKQEEVEIINSGTAQTLSRSNSYAAAAAGAPRAGGNPAGEKEKGFPGLRHERFSGLPGGPPGSAGPAAAATRGESSPLVVGGNGSTGGAFVSGGSGGSGSSFVSGGSSLGGGATGVANGAAGLGTAPGNNVGTQIGNALLNPASGHYQMPTPTAPPLPPDVQGSLMVIHKAAMGGGGPPLPPPVQAAVDNLEGQGAPEGPPPPP